MEFPGARDVAVVRQVLQKLFDLPIYFLILYNTPYFVDFSVGRIKAVSRYLYQPTRKRSQTQILIFRL